VTPRRLIGAFFGVALLMGSLAGPAHAASLGPFTAASLLGINQASTVSTPTVLGCDNFTGTNGTTMAARAATVAAACANQVWTANVGTWTIQTNKAASSATASAVATENTATANSTVQVVLTALNTSGRSGGVVLSHDGTSTYLAAVLIDGAPNRAELRIVVSGTSTLLTNVTPTIIATNTLQLSRSGSNVTVTLNGAVIISTTLTAGQVTSLGVGARAGLFGGDANVRFDDFLVTSP